MATFTVNTADDVVDGNLSQLSLREAVTLANATAAADTIVLANSLEGRTLVLTGGAMTLREDVTIIGDQDNDGEGVIINGNRQPAEDGYTGSHMFSTVGQSTAVSLSGLTLTNGYAEDGAAAISIGGGSLDLANCVISNNRTADYGDGAAIYAAADCSVSVADSRFTGNRSFDRGSAIGTYRGALMELSIVRSEFTENGSAYGSAILVTGNVAIADGTFTENFSGYGSGGALSVAGSLSILRSTISSNRAYNFGGGIFIVWR